MSMKKVTIFRPYPFTVGQKIRIEGSKRGGDWEVIGISDRKVMLKCPVSNKEVEWDLFCYYSEEKENTPWPIED